MSTSGRVSILFASLLVIGLLAAPAQAQDCSKLPATAQRARPCSPRQECVAQVERSLRGPALESARRDCQRLPAAGTCYGPETYSPQAECLERQGRRK
jgi:hypothetical protein